MVKVFQVIISQSNIHMTSNMDLGLPVIQLGEWRFRSEGNNIRPSLSCGSSSSSIKHVCVS